MSLGWEDVRRRLGDLSQLVSVTPVTLREGRSDGARALHVRSASGLDVFVFADRGLDIGPSRFGATPLAWVSSTGPTHPAYFQDHDWLRSFHGGLLTTCGLSNVGPSATIGDAVHPMHGRYSNLPAERVSWDITQDGSWPTVTVSGVVRETTVYGHDVTLRRTLTFPPDRPEVRISDEVINQGWLDHRLMLLYHFNVGFPILDDHAELVTGGWPIRPLNAAAAEEKQTPTTFDQPRAGQEAEVFCHDISQAQLSVGVWNAQVRVGEVTGLGVAINFDGSQLPYLLQWRMPGVGTYVTGLEPATCLGLGLEAEESADRGLLLGPGDRRTFDLSIAVVRTRSEIEDRGAGGIAGPPHGSATG